MWHFSLGCALGLANPSLITIDTGISGVTVLNSCVVMRACVCAMDCLVCVHAVLANAALPGKDHPKIPARCL